VLGLSQAINLVDHVLSIQALCQIQEVLLEVLGQLSLINGNIITVVDGSTSEEQQVLPITPQQLPLQLSIEEEQEGHLVAIYTQVP
jgi:hypothetical protein